MIKYHFNLPQNANFSEKYISYVNKLGLIRDVDAYMEVPQYSSPDEVGWAFITKRNVYIRPTEVLEEIELRLAHELTHIALVDQNYRMIGCNQDDSLGKSFANLLHHMILYPRLLVGGFSCDQDDKMVMKDLHEKFRQYSDMRQMHGSDFVAYAKINFMNDLIRISPQAKDEYMAIAREIVPDLISEAEFLLASIPNRVATMAVFQYEQAKMFIEKEINEKFQWLN